MPFGSESRIIFSGFPKWLPRVYRASPKRLRVVSKTSPGRLRMLLTGRIFAVLVVESC